MSDLHVTIGGEIFRLAPEVRDVVEALISERDALRAENERLRSELEAEQRTGRELYRALNAALERKPE